MLKSWKFWAVLAAIGAMVGLFAYGFTVDPKLVKSPLVGGPAPEFTVTQIGGQEKVSLGGLRGTPVVLNFWASWCVACRTEAIVLQAAHIKYEKNGRKIRVIGIAIQDTEEAALGFAKRFGKSYFLALDSEEGEISLNYGLYGVPETFFIDADGNVSYKHVGAVTPEILEREVGKMLGEKPSQDQG